MDIRIRHNLHKPARPIGPGNKLNSRLPMHGSNELWLHSSHPVSSFPAVDLDFLKLKTAPALNGEIFFLYSY